MTWTGQPIPTTAAYPGGGKISDGKSIKVAVPQNTTITAGKFYLLDGFFGCAMQGVVTGAGVTSEATLSLERAEYETDQIDDADTLAKGARIYWDVANTRFTSVPTDGIFAGFVTVAKDANSVIWFDFVPLQPVAIQGAAVVNVDAANGVAAAGANPTKAEFDVVVTLANTNKAQLNAALAALRAANLIAT